MSESTTTLECVEKNAVVNGVRLTYFERGMAHRSQKPTLLFLHATGFHARVWDKIINNLGNYHSIAVDQRGHGRSEKRQIGHWDEFITDVTELIIQLDLVNVVAIGHSMGAHALIGASASVEERIARIIAIDPVIPAEDAYTDAATTYVDSVEDHPTAMRKREFDSPEAMAERLRDKGSYGIFDPEMFMDYCRYGLLTNEQGKGYVLACPPEVEASVYMSSRSNAAIYEAVRSLEIPVLILRAKPMVQDRDALDFSVSPTWPGLVDEFKNAREIHFPDNTHFLPMEIPGKVTEIIASELKE